MKRNARRMAMVCLIAVLLGATFASYLRADFMLQAGFDWFLCR